MKRPFAVIVPVAIVAVVALAIWHFALRSDDAPRDRLELSGTVEATTIDVGTEVAGRVIDVTVTEGDRVVAGDVLVRLSTDLSEARLSQAQALSGAAREREDQSGTSADVQASVLAAEAARARRAVATAEARLADLLAGARPESIREAEAAVLQAEAGLQAARAELEKAEAGPRQQEIAAAQLQLQQAEERVTAAEARLDELREGTRTQEIDQARAAVESARVRAAKAEKDAGRMQALFDEGVISADRLEQAQTAAETARESLRAAQAALDLALAGPRQQQIHMAESSLQQARAARDQAAENLDLLREGTRPEDVRAAQAGVQQARAQLEAARQRLAALRAGPTRDQIRVARRQVDEARAALQLARERQREAEVARQATEVVAREAEAAEAAAQEASVSLEKHDILSTSGGIVDSVNVEPSEVVSPASSLVTLIDPEDVWVTVFVPEPEMPRVSVGQRAQVTVDGWDRPFDAQVYWIAEDAEFTPKYVLTEAERTRLVYEVRVRPDDPDGRLKPGMPADVTIFTD